MKQAVCAVIISGILFLAGCANPIQETSFYCTQERVCNFDQLSAYGLAQCAKDTGIVIPGLRQNFIPQGVCFWEEKDRLIISGYFMPLAGGHSAALVMLNATTGNIVGEYTLTDRNGRDLGGHFSGVAVTKNDIYVTGKRSLYRVSLKTLSEAGPQGALQIEEKIDIPMSADACNYSYGELWVCEYYQQERYPLEGVHKTRCTDQSVHHAWMVGYAVEDGLEIKCIMSIPDKVQGITKLSDGTILMSQSYGRNNESALLVFTDPRTRQPDEMVEIDGNNVPLWNLDSRYLLERISAPPMSEGCCAAKDGAYLIFESAAYYYNGFDAKNRSNHPIDTIWYFVRQ